MRPKSTALIQFAEVERARPRGGRMEHPKTGVLVVDDDPGIRGLLTAALARLGCAVWAAGNGHAAVQVYEQNRAAIDVALLDVRMPGLDGPQTLAALRAVDPRVRAVFMTGDPGRYTPDDLARWGLAVLRKPFASLEDLAETLRRAAVG